MSSIRKTLLWGLLLTVGLVTTVSALLGYVEIRHETDEVFDAELAQYARLLGALTSSAPDQPKPLQVETWHANTASNDIEALPEGHRYERKIAFAIWSGEANLLIKSQNFPASLPTTLTPGYADQPADGHIWRVFTLYDEVTGRWIMVAERDDIRGELSRELGFQVVLPLILGAPFAALLVLSVVRFSLRPITQLVEQLRERRLSELTPISVEQVPEEFRVLVWSINDLLRRLEGAYRLEKHFAADAAHELRTPLAALRVHLENAMAKSPGDSSLMQVDAATQRLQHLVEQLLDLARNAAEQVRSERQSLSLETLAREAVADLQAMAARRGQTLSVTAQGSSQLEADPVGIGMLLRNLLANAIQYSIDGDTIRIHIDGRDVDSLRLSVEDHGPGIPAQEQPRIFDRFYRARSRDVGVEGAGLGLAIVKRVVDLHRGSIALDSAGNGLRVIVTLPRRESCRQFTIRP